MVLRRVRAPEPLSLFDSDPTRERREPSVQKAFVTLRRAEPGPLPPPVDTMEGRWSAAEKATAEHALTYSIVGSAETVRRGIAQFVEREEPDEIIATAMIFDHPARLHSFEILAEIGRDLEAQRPASPVSSGR